MSQSNPFSFLENSTTRALLGTAAVATVGPGFLSEALALAPSAPQLVGESLRKLSIGNTLADAFGAGGRESQDSSVGSIPLSQIPTKQLKAEFESLQIGMLEGKKVDQERMRKIRVVLMERPDRFEALEGGDKIEDEQPPADSRGRRSPNPFNLFGEPQFDPNQR